MPTDGRSNTTTLTNDPMSRIKTQTDGVGTITWNYDGELSGEGSRAIDCRAAQREPMAASTRRVQRNPLTIVQGSETIASIFDDLGRVLTCTDTQRQTVAYGYDPEGNIISITYPDGKVVTYTYAGANRLETVTDWANRVTTYTYDDAGRLTQTARPNGTTCTHGNDAANRLTSTSDTLGATAIWQATHGYDAAYRLITFTPTPPTRTYAPPPATMTHDVDNRLITYNGQSVASDLDGNLLAAPLNGTLLGTLSWDARNRLIGTQSEINNQQSSISYSYDAENRRTSRTTDSQTTSYTWSRGGLDRLLVKSNTDGSITRYIYGLGLIYEETEPPGGSPTTTSFYHLNWQGSTMALTDSSGTVTARLSYLPYGEVTLVSGTVATPFLFNGQFGVLTEPNGLYCMMARFYSPVFRRFLSEDPAGFAGGINLYAYAAGDPVNLMDPFGLGPISWQQRLVNFLPEYAVDGLASIIFSQRLVDSSAGTGDILSFGLTDVWRNIDGSNSWVLKDSSAYAAGEWTGTGIGFAVGGAGLAKGFANAGSRTLKQQLYEIGQKTLTKSEYNYFVARNADPVKRGIDIVRQQGWLRASVISPSGLATQSLKTIGTGPTPNAARNIGPISAGAYGATVGGYVATK